MKDRIVYIGNWNRSGQRGISVCRFHEESGSLSFLKAFYEEVRVGNMCVNRNRDTLYFTDESPLFPSLKNGGGKVIACRINPQNGYLSKLCERETFATLPDHLTLDNSGDFLLVVHHGHDIPVTKTGCDAYGKYYLKIVFDDVPTVLYPITEDGSIGDACDIYFHKVSGSGKQLQPPHIHYIGRSPLYDLYAACDKGNDEICFLRLNKEEKKIEPCSEKGTKALPGGAPRYGAFHPSLPFFYANNEALPFISVFSYDAAGNSQRLNDYAILPDGRTAKSEYQQSDIRFHPNGRFLYSLIRGANAISVFKVKADGSLSLLQFFQMENSQGPRGCELSPDGRFLLVAAQESGEVITYSVKDDGTLSYQSIKLSLPCPGSILFI
ncbi:lactonase family protein [Hungatella hathewayi]